MKKPVERTPIGIMPILFGVIIVMTLGLRIFSWIRPPQPVPLLPNSDQIIKLSTFDQIASHTQTPVALPLQSFGAKLDSIGIYPNQTPSLPKNSVALVYVRDNARMMEMDILPDTSIEAQNELYKSRPQERVVIHGTDDGSLIQLPLTSLCVTQPTTQYPSFCPFSHLLLFKKNNTVIKLFSDSDKMTTGELIEVARSVPSI